MASKKISLLLADVDGTLVDSKKRITARAKAAIEKAHEAGVKFAVTSGRPPRGMKMVVEQVKLSAPIAAFNGGMFVEADTMKVLTSQTLDIETVKDVIERIKSFDLDIWVYADVEWYLRNFDAPHREKEEHTVQFPPKVVSNFTEALQKGVAKVVGVSDKYDLVAKAEKVIQAEFEHGIHARCTTASRDCEPSVSAARSQPYYLDVTHPKANKGAVVEWLSEYLKIPSGEIVTIGDMPNDLLMFKKSGYSIAMGQASDEVKKSAGYVTAGMDEEGFAKAVEEFVLK
jgi:Cof subfamily protein (haloacid dehalogenase superfamily)